MAAVTRRPQRWTKKTDELVRYLAHLCRPSLQLELGNWLEDNPRFRSFIADHQDKVRKKLSTSDEQARLDVRAELLVAYLVLGDRRFQVKFEAYGARQRGPDLSVTFRETQRFNLEVTRLRATENTDTDARLANTISGKLRQLPADVPNCLIITTNHLAFDEDSLAGAMRLIKTHRFQVEPGLQAQYPRLGGVFALDESNPLAGALFAANREARHPLPDDVVAGLSYAFKLNGG